MRPTEVGMSGLADRLNELFRTVIRPDTTGLWNNETAAWEISHTGPPVSAAYLSQLRTGARLKPSARHLAALAGMFHVRMESSFPPLEGPWTAGRSGEPSSAESRELALLHGVSPNGVAGVERTIARVRAAEDLPELPAGPLPDATDSSSAHGDALRKTACE